MERNRATKRERRALTVAVIIALLAGALWLLIGKSEVEVRLDLVAEAARAEFLADTSGFRFGTEEGKALYEEADFRYHAASRGWISERGAAGEVAFAYLVGGEGSFTMNLLDPCPAELVLEACAVEGGGGESALVRVYLNGAVLGEQRLPRGQEAHTLRFPVRAESFRAGANRFRLEVEGGVEMRLPGLDFPVTLSAFFRSAALEGVEGAEHDGPLADTGGDERALLQPAGTILHFYHLPREGEKLCCRVSAKGSHLEASIQAAASDGSPVTLFSRSLAAGKDRAALNLPLAPFAGRPCRITFTAGAPGVGKEGAFIRWSSPHILAVDEDGESSADHEPRTKNSPPASGKPDMVVLLLDAASSFFFRSCGGEDAATAASDALAGEGVVFERAVTPAPYTLPAVGSLFTGLLPDRHGVVRNANREGKNLRLAGEVETVASVLKRGGYRTLGVVTNPNAAALYGYGEGFDRYEELFYRPDLWKEGVAPGPATEQAKVLVREAKAKGDEPFFLYLHLFQPHAPYTPPSAYVERFTGDYQGIADGSRAVIGGFKDRGEPDLGPEDFEHLRNLYAANLAYVDDAVGEFLSWLRTEGLYEDALIVLCSDHGEAFGEHRSLEHGHHLYEEALRIPLLIKYPGGRYRGVRVKETVSLMDLAATLAAAGGALTDSLGEDSVDLTPLAAGGRGRPDRAFMARSDLFKPSFSLRWRSYQFIHDTWTRREELYDLAADPAQSRNLIETEGIVAGYLRSRLFRLRAESASGEAGEYVELDEAFIQSVEALGYTGGSRKN